MMRDEALERTTYKPSPYDLPEITPEDWTRDALCAQVGTDEWFPPKGGSTKAAKEICASCSVIDECLAYALRNHERFGIWGGLSERERRPLLGRAA